MALFSKTRVLFVLVVVIVFVIVCLGIDLTGQRRVVTKRNNELWRGMLSSSTPVITSDSRSLLQDRPIWAEHLESLRHILSWTRPQEEELVNYDSKFSSDDVDVGENMTDVGRDGEIEVDNNEEWENSVVHGSVTKVSTGTDHELEAVESKTITIKTEEVFAYELDKQVPSNHKTDLSYNRTGLSSNRTDLSNKRTGLATHRSVSSINTDLSSDKTGSSSNKTVLSSNKAALSRKTGDDNRRSYGTTNELKDKIETALVAALTSSENDSLSRKKIEVVEVNFSTSSKVRDFIKDIPPPVSLPWNKKQLLVSSKDIYHRQWVKDLQHFLQHSYDSAYPVTLVSTNQLFVESVINWLIHSLVVLESPLKNVLVLTMDEGVYGFLKNRSINVICVPAANNVRIDKPKNMMLMVRVEAARLLVLRMLNHWGIDVINYDNDAIVLRNPQSHLNALGEYDVIGSTGFMPYDLHDKWGITLCFGFFLIRATPATKKLWDVMCTLDVNDDQKKFNYALASMELQWRNRTSSNQFWQGHTNHHNISIAVFPLNKMCRGILDCNPALIDQYYVWHKGGGHKYNKMVKGSQKANLWLVKENWRQVSGEGKTAQEWLKNVANLGGRS